MLSSFLDSTSPLLYPACILFQRPPTRSSTTPHPPPGGVSLSTTSLFHSPPLSPLSLSADLPPASDSPAPPSLPLLSSSQVLAPPIYSNQPPSLHHPAPLPLR